MKDFRRLEADIARKYIGKPYFPGARGPNMFDCAGLCLYVYKNDIKRDIGEFFSESISIKKVDNPESLCIVSMKTGNGNSHSGLWFESDKGGILHCVMPFGVIFTKLYDLREIGITIDGYYKLV